MFNSFLILTCLSAHLVRFILSSTFEVHMKIKKKPTEKLKIRQKWKTVQKEELSSLLLKVQSSGAWVGKKINHSNYDNVKTNQILGYSKKNQSQSTTILSIKKKIKEQNLLNRDENNKNKVIIKTEGVGERENEKRQAKRW